MGLSGDLRDFDLSEVLQILVMGKKTGVLELVEEGTESVQGRVWLLQGRVMHAECSPGVEGVVALMDLLHTAKGRFRFATSSSAELNGLVTIDRGLEGLLLEASRDGME